MLFNLGSSFRGMKLTVEGRGPPRFFVRKVTQLLRESSSASQLHKAEATMNAQALRKFVEVNRSFTGECAELLAQRNKLEIKCSLYDRDREALMDFGNEAEHRVRDPEARVHLLEGEVQRLSEVLQLPKRDLDNQTDRELWEARMPHDALLESVVTSMINKGEAEFAQAFLEAHNSHESCKELLQMWDMLRPSTQKALSLAAMLKKFEKDKELCRINLCKAKDEANQLQEDVLGFLLSQSLNVLLSFYMKVKLFYKENSLLQEENKRLLLHYQRERSLSCSCSRSKTSASAKERRKMGSGFSFWLCCLSFIWTYEFIRLIC